MELTNIRFSFYFCCLLIRCSVDPYLFENFNTDDGDRLTAKFRAFKFPDSTYVQFRGTVNACVDKCQGIKCSNGQIGYGRRKREVAQSPELNKVIEISMTTFIRVDGEPVTKKDKGMFYRTIKTCWSTVHHSLFALHSHAIPLQHKHIHVTTIPFYSCVFIFTLSRNG